MRTGKHTHAHKKPLAEKTTIKKKTAPRPDKELQLSASLNVRFSLIFHPLSLFLQFSIPSICASLALPASPALSV